MPIGGSSYPPFLKREKLSSGLSRLNYRGMVLNQGATSDSPAGQSPKGPQTQGTSFLPKADATKTYSPAQQTQLEPDLQKAEQGVRFRQLPGLYNRVTKDVTKPKEEEEDKEEGSAALPSRQQLSATLRYSNAAAFLNNRNNKAATKQSSLPGSLNSDIPTDGSVMTSDEAKKRFAKVPIPRDVKMGFNERMTEQDNDEKSSALPSQQQLPATLRPTVEPKMTSTQLREYLKTIPGLKAVPKGVKDAFNKM